MAKAKVGQIEEEVRSGTVRLIPQEIIVDDGVDVRPWSGADDELEEIQKLAESMKEVGQIHPVSVRWKLVEGAVSGDDGHYYLFIGRRRYAAAMLINANAKVGELPIALECKAYYGLSDDQAVQMALIENSKRKDANPMDNAQNIANVRQRKGWLGGEHTKDVAKYFEMSPAWVTTHEKLLTIEDKAVQSMVSQGQMSADAAFTYVKVDEKDRLKVFETAKKIMGEEAPVTSGVIENAQTPVLGTKKKVGKKHIKKAIEKTQAQTTTAVARTKKDLLEFFSRFDSLDYGFKNGAVRDFVSYLEKWASGQGSDKMLTGKFDFMVDGAFKGSEQAEDKPKPKTEVVTKAKGKKVVKPKKAKPVKKKSAKTKTKVKSKPKK